MRRKTNNSNTNDELEDISKEYQDKSISSGSASSHLQIDQSNNEWQIEQDSHTPDMFSGIRKIAYGSSKILASIIIAAVVCTLLGGPIGFGVGCIIGLTFGLYYGVKDIKEGINEVKEVIKSDKLIAQEESLNRARQQEQSNGIPSSLQAEAARFSIATQNVDTSVSHKSQAELNKNAQKSNTR